MKRPGWWKGKFVLFQRLATGVGGQTCVQSPSPSTDNQGERVFKGEFFLGGAGRGRGLPAEAVWSALTVILKEVSGGLTSIFFLGGGYF